MAAENPIPNPPAGAGADPYEAFVRLLVEHEPRLRSYLRGLLPSWEDVDEVTQNASLVAWRKFPQFQEGTNFGGWLLTISRFEALKHRRRLARSPLVFSEEIWEKLAHDAGAEPEQREVRREALEQCLGKLPAEQRDLLLRAHAPGVRLNQIALHAGCSEQAFYKTIQRLRAALLECINLTLTKEGWR